MKNIRDRRKRKPKRVGEGWLIKTGSDQHEVTGRRNKKIKVAANYIHGHLQGVWIEDAGVNGKGQVGFQLYGHPDFLDELADALRLLAEHIRTTAGWNQGD